MSKEISALGEARPSQENFSSVNTFKKEQKEH
jgi:hypothetical protein